MTRLLPLALIALVACVEAPGPDLTDDALRARLADHMLVRDSPGGGEGVFDGAQERIELRADGSALAGVVLPEGPMLATNLRWVVRGADICLIAPDEPESGGQCATATIDGDRITTREVNSDGSITTITGRIVPL